MTLDKKFSYVLLSNAIGGPVISAIVHHRDFKDSKKWFFLPVLIPSMLVRNGLFYQVLIPWAGDNTLLNIGLTLLYMLILGVIGAWGYRRCSKSVGADIAASNPGFGRRECIGIVIGILLYIGIMVLISLEEQPTPVYFSEDFN